MSIENIKMLYFSPTGTTKKIVRTIANAIQCGKKEIIDITSKKIREDVSGDFTGDLVILGAPVYYGRIPEEVARYFSRVKVDNTPAVLVVVYGNREYEDALLELNDLACAAGFVPIAGAAFIGEHSYSSENLPMAPGRPDELNLARARLFAAKIKEKFDTLVKANQQISLPGNSDYASRAIPNYPFKIQTLEQCVLCDICMESCPVDAISIDNESILQTDAKLCILCFACVKNCPLKARGINNVFWSQGMEMLHKQCLQRKEPELFFRV